MQVRVLFRKELDKVYDPNEPVDDMREREEEMERMREHVFKGKPHWLNSNFDKFWYLSPQMKSDKGFGVIFDESHFSFKYRSMLHDPILIQVSLSW